MTIIVSDNASTFLASAITAIGETTVTIGDPSHFPPSGSLSKVKICYARLGTAEDNEVVPITDISGGDITLTCSRTWPIGTQIIISVNSSVIGGLAKLPIRSSYTVKTANGDFTSIQNALDYFSTVCIVTPVTVNIDPGVWDMASGSIVPKRNSELVRLVGSSITTVNITSASYSGTTITATVSSTTGITTGQYVYISYLTGGTNPRHLYGVFPITSVGSNTVSFNVSRGNVSPSGSISGQMHVFKTIITGTSKIFDVSLSSGELTRGIGYIDKILIAPSGSPSVGIYVDDGLVVNLGNVGFHGGEVHMRATRNGCIMAKGTGGVEAGVASSYATQYGAQCDYGGQVHFNYATFSRHAGQALDCNYHGLVSIQNGYVGHTQNFGLGSMTMGYSDFYSTTFEYNSNDLYIYSASSASLRSCTYSSLYPSANSVGGNGSLIYVS